jgi:hypothetical protein
METVSTSETSVYFNETTRCCVPEYCRIHTRRYKNLKSHKETLLLGYIVPGLDSNLALLCELICQYLKLRKYYE